MIIQLLPEPVQVFLQDFLGKQCFKRVLVDFNFEPECMKLLLSKALGVGLVAGGAFVKLPQILKIVSSKSAQGLSLVGNLMELLCYLVSLSYSHRREFPFTTYGEVAFLTVQDIVIVALIMLHGRRALLLPYLVALVAASYAFFFVAPLELLGQLFWASTFVVVISRLPQIAANARNGNTGQLSAATVFMFAAGSSARIFTTLQEVDDPAVLLGYVLGTAVNLVLAFQVLYYWNAKPAAAAPAAAQTASGAAQPKGAATATGASKKPSKKEQ